MKEAWKYDLAKKPKTQICESESYCDISICKLLHYYLCKLFFLNHNSKLNYKLLLLLQRIPKPLFLFLLGPPYIVSPPENITVNISQNALFTCQAEAYPGNLTYTWFWEEDNVYFKK